eukprot:gene3535-3776_t
MQVCCYLGPQHSPPLFSKFKLYAFKPFIIKEHNRRIPVLVHEKEVELVKLLQTWSEESDKFDANLFQALMKQKKIVSAGKNSNFNGVKDYYGTKPCTIQQLRKKFARVNVYVNQGTSKKPVLIKLSAALDQDTLKKTTPEELVQAGQGYKNITELFEVEKKANADQSLVHIMNSNHAIGSKPWLNWAKYQQDKGEYTLQHAVAEYLSPFSDIKGENANHRRKAGVVGTQAIGDTAREALPLDQFPSRIPHPWQSFQEIPWNCKFPNSHPNIIPPAVWVCKMDMSYYRVNDLAVKENDDGLVLGGDMMTWDDALKIAAYSVEGESRDESYQLPHSTGITDDPDIPFYNPVYKSNIKDSDKLPFIEEVYDVLDWKLNYDDREQLNEVITDEVKNEEEQRKQKLLSMGYDLEEFGGPETREEEIQLELRRRYNSTVKQVMEYFDRCYEGIREASQRNLSNYELIKQFNLSDEVLSKIPKDGIVWNYFLDGRPDNVDRVVLTRYPNEESEEVITWSRFNESSGVLIDNYLKAIEQYYYDEYRKELVQNDERFVKLDRTKEEIVEDFVSRIFQYQAMMSLNPYKREQHKKRKMTLVRPATDPSRSYFSQFTKQTKDETEAGGIPGVNRAEDYSDDEDVSRGVTDTA